MSKDTAFIRVNIGMLDPRHVEAMGHAVWLYLFLLSRVDWETGITPHDDDDAGVALGKSARTIRRWRTILADGGYVIATMDDAGFMHIKINKWRNPSRRPAPVATRDDDEWKAVVKAWETVRGMLTPFDVQALTDELTDLATHLAGLPEGHPDKSTTPGDFLVQAIKETGKSAQRPNLKYLGKVVDGWKQGGIGWNPFSKKATSKQKLDNTHERIDQWTKQHS